MRLLAGHQLRHAHCLAATLVSSSPCRLNRNAKHSISSATAAAIMASQKDSDTSTTGGTSIVCYHYPCVDGIYSALAAHLHFRATSPPTPVRFFPLTVYKQHSVEELGLNNADTVYMCDFTGPDGFVQGAAAIAKRVVVLDHHKTAYEQLQGVELPPNVELHMDMHRSGAMIALDYFTSQGTISKEQLPQALRQAYAYVQDADLWSWKVEGSKAFGSGFKALNLELDVNKNTTAFRTLLDMNLDQLMASGAALLSQENDLIASALAGAFEVQLGGARGAREGWGRALAVRIDEGMSKHRSRLGNELAALSVARGLKPIAVVAYRETGMADPSLIKLSLRGRDEGKGEGGNTAAEASETDTTPISTAFGGGGHRLASSCIVPNSEFDSWLLPAA